MSTIINIENVIGLLLAKQKSLEDKILPQPTCMCDVQMFAKRIYMFHAKALQVKCNRDKVRHSCDNAEAERDCDEEMVKESKVDR